MARGCCRQARVYSSLEQLSCDFSRWRNGGDGDRNDSCLMSVMLILSCIIINVSICRPRFHQPPGVDQSQGDNLLDCTPSRSTWRVDSTLPLAISILLRDLGFANANPMIEANGQMTRETAPAICSIYLHTVATSLSHR